MGETILFDEADSLYTDLDGEFWYPGTSPSSYNGGHGIDTLDFSNSTADLLWYQPIGYNWVQDPSVPLGQQVDEDLVAEYGYATLQFWEHVIAGNGQDTMYAAGTATGSGMTLDSGLGNDVFMVTENTFHDGSHYNGNLGDDIINFNEYYAVEQPLVIDLNQGTITNYRGWVATIEGVENVYGSFSDDTIIPGADSKVMNGDVGQDFFDINAGAFVDGQTYIGDVGYDTLSFADRDIDVLVDLSLGVIQAPGPDVLGFVYTMEAILAGSGDDTLIGTTFGETLVGGAGNDSIEGGVGEDELTGKKGNDTILGGDGKDTISGNNGRDSILGGANADEVTGNAGDDTIQGEDGADTLKGGDGDDAISGGKGKDSIEGGEGMDTLKGSGGADTLNGGKDNDSVDGGDGKDLVKGSGGDDTLTGGKGKDTLKGGSGDDSLKGGDDNDRLVGGDGHDTMNGGDGSDRFVFDIGHGDDALGGFEAGPGGDVLDFRNLTDFTSLDDVIDAGFDTASGAFIVTGSNSTILLGNTSLSELTDDNFLFS